MTIHRIGSEARVNITTEDHQAEASVTALADGGWVVTWTSWEGDGSRIYQQCFDRNGVAASVTDVLVDTAPNGIKMDPEVTALADGGWVVTWTSKQDGNFDVYQQRFMLEKAPHDVTLSANSVQEGAAAGTLVGVVTGHDVNLISGDQLTYTLLDTADGRFTLSGNQILVADGFRLDHEQAPSHTVKVQVKDRAGNTFAKDLTIGITDVYQEITAGSVANDVFKSGAAADQLSGNAGNDRLFSGAGNDILKG
ncbi:MAG TPA: hypothetical protein VEZ16_06120, partial [Microvirga sp.]|nr:hypothetical protein [Microvirga sp.]